MKQKEEIKKPGSTKKKSNNHFVKSSKNLNIKPLPDDKIKLKAKNIKPNHLVLLSKEINIMPIKIQSYFPIIFSSSAMAMAQMENKSPNLFQKLLIVHTNIFRFILNNDQLK